MNETVGKNEDESKYRTATMGEWKNEKKQKMGLEKESDVDRSANAVAEEVFNVRPLKVAHTGPPILAFALGIRWLREERKKK